MLSDIRAVHQHRNSGALEYLAGTDSRAFQQLWRLDCPSRENYFLVRKVVVGDASSAGPDANSTCSIEEHAPDVRMLNNREVLALANRLDERPIGTQALTAPDRVGHVADSFILGSVNILRMSEPSGFTGLHNRIVEFVLRAIHRDM